MEPKSRKTGKHTDKIKASSQKTKTKNENKEESLKTVPQKGKQNNIQAKITEIIQKHTENQETMSFPVQIPIQSLMRRHVLLRSDIKIDGDKLRYETDIVMNDWIKHLEWMRASSTKTKHCKNVKLLKISLREYRCVKNTDPTLDCFKMLGSMISRSFPKLQKLDLNLAGWLRMSDQDLKVLARELCSNLVHLKCLHIHFTSITRKGIEVLVNEVCKFLPNLTELSLESFMTDEGLKVLSSKIGKYLHNLKKFNLMLGHQWITPEGMEVFTSNISKRADKLEHFKVISSIAISEENMKSLIRTLCKNLINLRSLKFVFNLPSLKQKTIWESLAQITQHLIHLERLFFNFSSPDANVITKENENEISPLNQLTNLKTLELKLGESLTSQGSLLLLASKINQTFPNLENLGLTIVCHSYPCDISYKSLEGLVFDICCSLPNLKELHIDFSKARDIARNCPKDFKSNIPKSRLNLKKLDLDFSSCSRTSDNFLDVLGVRIIFFFTTLQDLDIKMPAQKLQAGAIEKFGTLVSKNLHKLKSFKLE